MRKKKAKTAFSPALAAAAGLAGLAAAFLIAWGKGLKPGMPLYRAAGCLAGGFLLSGLLISGIGAVILLVSCGVFDRAAYARLRKKKAAAPDPSGKRLPAYAAFRRQRAAQRAPRFTVLAVGLVFLLLAAALGALYYNLPAR